MKKNNLLKIVLLLCSCSIFSQNNDKAKEYTSLSDALKEPEKVVRLNLSNQNINLSNAINLNFQSRRCVLFLK